MEKRVILKSLSFVLFILATISCGSSKSATNQSATSTTSKSVESIMPEYSLKKEIKEKIAGYTKSGWKIHGSTRTLKGKLIEHYTMVAENPNYYEIIGTSNGCRSISVCRASASNAASVDFARRMGQDLKGKNMRDLGIDEGTQMPEEYNKFQEACISKFQASIEGDMIESFSLIKTNENGLNSYEIYYLVDKEVVKTRRAEAIRKAIAESKLRQEYATSVEKFINESIEK